MISESEIEEKLQRILDINLKFMDKVVSELSDLKHVLFKITPSDISQSLYKIPFEQIPIKYASNSQKKSKKDKVKNKREKEKLKITIGPPKRMADTPPSNKIKFNENDIEKITKDKIFKIKSSLKPPTLNSSIPMAPKTRVQESVIDFESLKPPQPPQSISNPKLSVEGTRAQIILELKEIFKMKGLTGH